MTNQKTVEKGKRDELSTDYEIILEMVYGTLGN